jgi:nucleotide-binding universal stress UspA family protein
MKLLVATDGSPASLAAAQHALDLVRAGLKARFVVANVQDHPSLYEVATAHDPEVLDRVIQAAGEHALEATAALFSAAGLAFEREVGAGDPAQVLIEIAQRHHCSAIVMGARGQGALRAGLLGSVSQSVLQRASVPVTLVKQRADDDA